MYNRLWNRWSTTQHYRWRHELRARAGVRLLFLNSAARTAGDQRLLEAEAGEQGDILQCGVEDGHRRLGYKV